MNATNSAETKPAPKSFWRMEAPRWCNWFMFWLIIIAIPLCAAISYAGKQKSPSVGCAVLAVFLTANYLIRWPRW